MLRRIMNLCWVAAIGAALVSQASASIGTHSAIIIDRYTAAGNNPPATSYVGTSNTQISSNGGEFRVRELDSAGLSLTPAGPVPSSPTYQTFHPTNLQPVLAGGDVFKTFCLEYNEHVDITVPGNSYWATIDRRAYQGGAGGGGPIALPYDPAAPLGTAGDPVSHATAWLYGHYREGTLDDQFAPGTWKYLNGGTAATNYAAALQDAIWYLENEIGAVAGLAATLVNQALLVTGNNAHSADDMSDKVGVMNLWSERTKISTGLGDRVVYKGIVQSQLYYDADGGFETPEPATILVWSGLAAIGLIGYRRRRAS